MSPASTPFQYCDGPLPLAPGTSPFHIKGEYYRQTALVVAQHDQRTGGAVLRILEREGLRAFAEQTFLASALYDVLPMPRIVMALAEAGGRDVRELTGKMGRAGVEAQLGGVYGNLLRAVRPANFCERFDQAINYFYDFGPLCSTPQDGGARLTRTGVPLCIAEWWSIVTGPFAELPLTMRGAKGVSLAWRIEATGEDRGVPCGTVLGDLRFTAPAEG